MPAAGTPQAMLGNYTNSYSQSTPTRDRSMEQQYNYNGGGPYSGQDQNLGRYVPPMLGDVGANGSQFQNQGPYAFNNPNSYGSPYGQYGQGGNWNGYGQATVPGGQSNFSGYVAPQFAGNVQTLQNQQWASPSNPFQPMGPAGSMQGSNQLSINAPHFGGYAYDTYMHNQPGSGNGRRPPTANTMATAPQFAGNVQPSNPSNQLGSVYGTTGFAGGTDMSAPGAAPGSGSLFASSYGNVGGRPRRAISPQFANRKYPTMGYNTPFQDPMGPVSYADPTG